MSVIFISNTLGLKSEEFFLRCFQFYKVKPVPTLWQPQLGCITASHTWTYPPRVWRVCLRTVLAPACTYTPRVRSHLLKSQLWYLYPPNTHGSDAFFFFCITASNKGNVTFLSMLSSGYAPLSPHDANFHPYKDIFCRAVLPWCNFRDKQMVTGLWRCYWIVTVGNKVPAEKSTVWLPRSKLSYQLWQLRKRNVYVSFCW